MKIAMVLLHKEFYRRGWLRDWLRNGTTSNQQDIVRMLLSVHDELVFEIRHDQVIHVVPVIVTQMEAPTKMALPPFSPPWKVPLVTEPLVGLNWGAGYPCERVASDHVAKEGEAIHNGFLYGTIRTVDLGKETPKEGEVEYSRDEKAKKLKIRITEPPWLLQAGIALPEPVTAPKVVSEPLPELPQPAPSSLTSSAEKKPPRVEHIKIAVIRLSVLNNLSVRQVRGIIAANLDTTGPVLHLVDGFGKTLVDPRFRIQVSIERVAQTLREHHLSDGKIAYENTTVMLS
jgi:hypothetical protein